MFFVSGVVTTSYKIGVDGGGTKTELILVDAAGTVVAMHTAPGCNPSQVGPERAREILLAGLRALLETAARAGLRPPLSGLHLFLAGAQAYWQETAHTLTGFGPVTSNPDSLPVLELATNGAPGLVLHAGTGSFVAARAPDGSIHYAGGLGWRIGDAGSGFDLGRRAIAQALLELQGWAQSSGLGDALKSHTGLASNADISRYLYTEPDANFRIAAFAIRVVALAAAGCNPAQAVLNDTISELVAQARLVTTKLFGANSVPCGVSGALLNSEPAAAAIRAQLVARQWAVELNFISAPAIEGVRRLLAKG